MQAFPGGQEVTNPARAAHQWRKTQNHRLIRLDMALVLLLTVQWNIVLSAECWGINVAICHLSTHCFTYFFGGQKVPKKPTNDGRYSTAV
jgi:hypothetical protein